MNTQPRLQEEQHEPPDHQPVIIEQYRGPLLDQLREQESETKLMLSKDQPAIVGGEHQPTPYSARYSITNAAVRLQNLCNRVSEGWQILTGPFGAGDDVLDWTRIGILFQLICVALLILFAVVIKLLPIQFMSPLALTLLFNTPRMIVLPFYLVGLFNSTRAAVLYHRSRHPYVALALGLIPYIELVIGILLFIGIFK